MAGSPDAARKALFPWRAVARGLALHQSRVFSPAENEMPLFIFFYSQSLHSRRQLCQNCYQKKRKSRSVAIHKKYFIQPHLRCSISHLLHLGPESLLLLLPLEKVPVLKPLSPPHHLRQPTSDRVNQLEHAPHWIFFEMSPSCSPKSCC